MEDNFFFLIKMGENKQPQFLREGCWKALGLQCQSKGLGNQTKTNATQVKGPRKILGQDLEQEKVSGLFEIIICRDSEEGCDKETGYRFLMEGI